MTQLKFRAGRSRAEFKQWQPGMHSPPLLYMRTCRGLGVMPKWVGEEEEIPTSPPTPEVAGQCWPGDCEAYF